QKYFKKHFQFDSIFKAPPTAEEQAFIAKRKRKAGFFIFLQFLRMLPITCGIAFGICFFWDFGNEDQIELFGQVLEMNAFIRMISVSGLIGFGTNWVAVKMLFKPVFKRPIWGQGLIPAHKERIVWQMAGGIHKHILNEELIRDRINESGLIPKINQILIRGVENLLDDEEFSREVKAIAYTYVKKSLAKPETRERFAGIIDEKLDENLKGGLSGFVFQAYKKLNRREYQAVIDNILNRVPGTVVNVIEEVEDEREAIAEAIRSREKDVEVFILRVVLDVLDRIDIRTLLSKQMAHFDEAKLEQLIWSATNEQLLYIEYLGTLLGIFGGLLIWQPIAMGIVFVGTFILLFLLDIILHHFKKDNIGSRKA
ncbi:MAG: hypothetical protein RLZZ519_2722, partial [Bacteroidota bacterium]